MGTGSSVNAHRENVTEDRTTFGDRVEITRTLPVENFGQDDAHRNINTAMTQRLSTESVHQDEARTTRTASQRKPSIRSLMSSLTKRSEDHATEAKEAADLKLQRVLQLKGNLEVESERLRREISSLRANVSKWRNESVNARQDEKQALVRAENLEQELVRVRRRFKCYRDGKEKEIHNLLKKKYELEYALRCCSNGDQNNGVFTSSERFISPFNNDCNIENISLFRASGSLENVKQKVPDYNTFFPLSPEVMENSARQKQSFKLFLSVDDKTQEDAVFFKMNIVPRLEQLCQENGKFLILVEFDCNNGDKDNTKKEWRDSVHSSKCDLFVGLLGDASNKQLLDRWEKSFQIFTKNGHPVFYCIKDTENSLNSGTELTHFIDTVSKYNKTKVFFYPHISKLIEENNNEIKNVINEYFDIVDVSQKLHNISDEQLMCDYESSHRQYDILHSMTSAVTTTDTNLSKCFDQLNDYVSCAGPSPPLLVLGSAGSGKTTLLAKWIISQLNAGDNIVLYHFVCTTTNDSTTDPGRVMKRFTSQLFGLVPCLFSMLRCDPVKGEEYFPRLLETVPSQLQASIIIVIDSLDKLENVASSSHFSWLNDPLPITVRVVLSMEECTKPKSLWSSWPELRITPLTQSESCNFLLSKLRNQNLSINDDQVATIVESFPEKGAKSPLYMTMISHELSKLTRLNGTEIEDIVAFQNVTQLTEHMLGELCKQHGDLVEQMLGYICSARTGLPEQVIMELLSVKWSDWLSLYNSLVIDRPIVVEISGLLFISHDQIMRTILAYLSQNDRNLKDYREHLVEFYLKKLEKSFLSHSLLDQLPWLLEKLGRREELREFLSRIDVFQMYFRRSLFSELFNHWKFLNEDISAVGKIYFDSLKKEEGRTPCLEMAFSYEVLGRLLKSIESTRQLAMKCLEQSLEMKELVLENDDVSVGQSLHYLADLYVARGNLESAESSYKQTLAINERALGKDHVSVAKALESLAYVKKKQNNEKAHSELLRKAARIRGKHHMISSSQPCNMDKTSLEVKKLGAGCVTAESASSLHNLGVLFMIQKKYDDAETLFKKSVEKRENLFGSTNPAIVQSLESLASVYVCKKAFSEAIVHYERSLAIKQQNLDRSDPDLISTMNKLATVLWKDGNLEQSEAMYKNVLAIVKDKHDDQDPVIATALHNLAVVNCEQNKLEEALELFKKAVDIYEDTLGSYHPKVGEGLRNLAKVYLDMGNPQEASLHLRRSQMIQDDDSTMTTISSQPSLTGVSSMMGDSTSHLATT